MISKYNYRFRFGDRSIEQLKEYNAMLEDLSYHVSTDIPVEDYKELNAMLYHAGVAIRLSIRDKQDAQKANSIKRKNGVAVLTLHHKVSKPIKLRKKI